MAKKKNWRLVVSLLTLSDREFGRALKEVTKAHALDYAWADSKREASLKKLDGYLASLDDRSRGNGKG